MIFRRTKRRAEITVETHRITVIRQSGSRPEAMAADFVRSAGEPIPEDGPATHLIGNTPDDDLRVEDTDNP